MDPFLSVRAVAVPASFPAILQIFLPLWQIETFGGDDVPFAIVKAIVFFYNIFGNNSDEAKDNVKNTFQLKKSQFSWNIGLGIMFLKHFEVGATYNLSIGKTGEIKNMTKEEIEDAPKQKSWAISAAYYF